MLARIIDALIWVSIVISVLAGIVVGGITVLEYIRYRIWCFYGDPRRLKWDEDRDKIMMGY